MKIELSNMINSVSGMIDNMYEKMADWLMINEELTGKY